MGDLSSVFFLTYVAWQLSVPRLHLAVSIRSLDLLWAVQHGLAGWSGPRLAEKLEESSLAL